MEWVLGAWANAQIYLPLVVALIQARQQHETYSCSLTIQGLLCGGSQVIEYSPLHGTYWAIIEKHMIAQDTLSLDEWLFSVLLFCVTIL